MGLLTIVKKQKLKDKEKRCLLLGLDNAGKSTIVNQLVPPDRRQAHISPTVGFAIHNVQIPPYNVAIWDVGGQSTLRPFWDNYYDTTDVLVWCIDISSTQRLPESLKELQPFLTGDSRVIIVLNKCDLLADYRLKGLDLEEQLPGVQFVYCSGKTGMGMHELCKAIASTDI